MGFHISHIMNNITLPSVNMGHPISHTINHITWAHPISHTLNHITLPSVNMGPPYITHNKSYYTPLS